jgi:putative ABC transport system permease protein
MRLHPIIVALKRHKSGVVLIVLQIALTLAIVCNAVFIIAQRVDRLNRPTGVAEASLFRVSTLFVGAPLGDDKASLDKLDALQLSDINTLRHVPDVLSASASNAMPLQGGIWVGGVGVKPDQKTPTSTFGYYYGDEQMISTLGVKLIAGRNFNAGEVIHHTINDTSMPPVSIVSKHLADKLYPKGDALGKTVFIDSKPSTVIGIIDTLQVSNGGHMTWAYDTIMQPVRLSGAMANYAIRAKPGRLREAMRESRAALIAANPMRVMPDSWGVMSMGDIRDKAYRGDRGMALLMVVVCVILLGVTAAGIVGLTSFWVGQRRRQIGVRRALGARRVDILRYFQIENLFISSAGVILGVMLALGFSLWLMSHYEMPRLPVIYMLVGVVMLLVIGQVAVFVPARRASLVPPVEATRAA